MPDEKDENEKDEKKNPPSADDGKASHPPIKEGTEILIQLIFAV